MSDIKNILQRISTNLNTDKKITEHQLSAEIELADLKSHDNFKKNKGKVLITAGPTFERIDDVRYIGNFSSGKMGFALAQTSLEHGFETVLITGPVSLQTSKNIKRIDIESAHDMYEAVHREFSDSQITIMSAAVADFTPINKFNGKLKKQEIGENLILELKPTQDILSSLGKIKSEKQFLVGFALESRNEIDYGRKKLIDKNCDMIVVNSANKPQSGFQGDFNTISILTRFEPEDFKVDNYEAMTKKKCAEIIFDKILEVYKFK